MADVIASRLKDFQPSKNEKYDPGKIVILFDDRLNTTADDKFSTFQSYWTSALYRMSWPSLSRPDLDPGNIRLIWYTHVGNQGTRDYPLYRAYAVKEMFDSLSQEGFRPMVLGWSGENPFPMIGGSEPPPEPKKPKIKVATTSSGSVSGHGNPNSASTSRETTTPHERVMRIIGEEERREAEGRKKEVQDSEKSGRDIKSPV